MTDLVFVLVFVSFCCLMINALFFIFIFVLLVSHYAWKGGSTENVCHVVYVYSRVKGQREGEGMTFEVRTHRVGLEALG